jgi:hypothetical protein
MVVSRHRLPGLHWLFYNLPIPSLSPVVTAARANLFLFARECRFLSSFFLVIGDYEDTNVTHVGGIYLLAPHLGAAPPAAHSHVSQPEVNDWRDFFFP